MHQVINTPKHQKGLYMQISASQKPVVHVL